MNEDTIDARIEAVAARQGGLFSVRQAAALGADAQFRHNRVRSHRWHPVTRGVYRFAGTAMEPVQWARAAVLAGPDGAVAARRTAAALWQLPGFRPGPVDCLVPTGRSHRPRTGRVHHSKVLPPHHVATVDCVPVTTPARTLFDLAATVHPGRLERAVDHALAMRLTSAKSLHAMLDELAASGRNGIGAMRVVLADRPASFVAPASALEARFASIVRRAGLPEPARQVELGGEEWIGRVDFFYGEYGLIVEIDSDRFHASLTDARYDAERDRRFAELGLRTFRCTEHEVWHEPEQVVHRLRSELRRRAA